MDDIRPVLSNNVEAEQAQFQADLEANVEFAQHPMYEAFLREVRDAAEPIALAHYARYDGDVPTKEEVDAFIRRRCVAMGNPAFPVGPEYTYDIASGWAFITDLEHPHVVIRRKNSQFVLITSRPDPKDRIGAFANLSDAISCVFDNTIEDWAEAFVAHRREEKAGGVHTQVRPGYSDEELAAMANVLSVTEDTFDPAATSQHEPKKVVIDVDASLSLSKEGRQAQIDNIAVLLRRACEAKNLGMAKWLYEQLPVGHRYQGFRSDGTLIGPYNDQREAGATTYDPRSKEA